MNLNLRPLLLLLSQWLIAAVILSWEQSFSVPFLFFVFGLISVRLQPKYYRELLLFLLGISFAGLYNFWFGVGIMWIFGLLGISYAIGHFLPALRIRITLASLLGCTILAYVIGLDFTWPRAIILGSSIALFWIISIFVRWDVRQVPVSKANWGWQQQ